MTALKTSTKTRLDYEAAMRLRDAAPALLKRLKWHRDNFGVNVPADFAEKIIAETDELIASVSPGWPKVR